MKVPVTSRALVQRINRAIQDGGLTVRKTRGRAVRALGQFHIVDRSSVAAKNIRFGGDWSSTWRVARLRIAFVRVVVKTALLIRITEVDKARLRAAANQRGLSMTTYLLEAVTKQLSRDELRRPRRSINRVVDEAERGGSHGYATVGLQFAQDHPEIPLANPSVLMAWLQWRHPQLMKRIPQRRHAQFVTGIKRAQSERCG